MVILRELQNREIAYAGFDLLSPDVGYSVRLSPLEVPSGSGPCNDPEWRGIVASICRMTQGERKRLDPGTLTLRER